MRDTRFGLVGGQKNQGPNHRRCGPLGARSSGENLSGRKRDLPKYTAPVPGRSSKYLVEGGEARKARVRQAIFQMRELEIEGLSVMYAGGYLPNTPPPVAPLRPLCEIRRLWVSRMGQRAISR